jgi:ABC-2 type transport system permease protein
MASLHRFAAFLKRDYLLASASRLSLVWQLLSVFFAAPILFYLGRLIQPATSQHLAPFGGDYFAFVTIGVAFFGFLAATMASSAAAVRHEQMIGTLEAVLIAPASPHVLVLGASLWNISVAVLQGSLYIVVGALIFGLEIHGTGLLAAVLVSLIAVATFAAVGMLSTALVVILRHGDPLSGLIAAGSALLGGVFYPTSVLPQPLQRLSEFIPLTHALRALRLALLQGHGVSALQREMVILLLFLGVLGPLAVFALRWAIRQAKTMGTLGAY